MYQQPLVLHPDHIEELKDLLNGQIIIGTDGWLYKVENGIVRATAKLEKGTIIQ